MPSLLQFPLDQLPFLVIVVAIAFTLHEFAHAYAADRFGDPTPRSMGRVSLNPRVHMDIFGILLILLAGFGWAKPVLIDPRHFKRPRMMNIVVSLVGPLSNLILAFAGVVVAYLLAYFNMYDMMSPGVFKAVALFLRLHIYLNLGLFIFNLLPLPPLDGYRILFEFLPNRTRGRMQGYEQWAFFIFLLIVFINPLYHVTLGPIMDLRWSLLSVMNHICISLFGAYKVLSQIGIFLY